MRELLEEGIVPKEEIQGISWRSQETMSAGFGVGCPHEVTQITLKSCLFNISLNVYVHYLMIPLLRFVLWEIYTNHKTP
jgi:hypothetical protein